MARLGASAEFVVIGRGVNPEADVETANRPIARCLRDLIGFATGALVLLLSALPVDEHRLSAVERAGFRFLNGFPAFLNEPVWLVMQLGNIVVVPLATLAALLARRFRLAASLATSGMLTYVGAKLVKRVVTRGRPSGLVDDVNIHGAAAHGLGFVSGHAGVAVALAVVAFPYLGPRSRWVAVALAGFVCIARVYVGAHLPLDVVGGAALGIVFGFGARLIFGRPVPRSESLRTARCS